MLAGPAASEQTSGPATLCRGGLKPRPYVPPSPVTIRKPTHLYGRFANRPTANRLENPLQNPDGALLPRHPVRDARSVLELAQVIEVPAEVPDQGLFVREFGCVIQLLLG